MTSQQRDGPERGDCGQVAPWSPSPVEAQGLSFLFAPGACRSQDVGVVLILSYRPEKKSPIPALSILVRVEQTRQNSIFWSIGSISLQGMRPTVLSGRLPRQCVTDVLNHLCYRCSEPAPERGAVAARTAIQSRRTFDHGAPGL